MMFQNNNYGQYNNFTPVFAAIQDELILSSVPAGVQ